MAELIDFTWTGEGLNNLFINPANWDRNEVPSNNTHRVIIDCAGLGVPVHGLNELDNRTIGPLVLKNTPSDGSGAGFGRIIVTGELHLHSAVCSIRKQVSTDHIYFHGPTCVLSVAEGVEAQGFHSVGAEE